MINVYSSFTGKNCWSFCTFIGKIFVQNTEDAVFSENHVEIIAFICYNNL